MTPMLHHYPSSLFSEKVRIILGYLRLEWQSVIIPPIMPRPDLIPLSGGYRKTPILQIGAHVYCDTEVICRRLAALAGDAGIYTHGFVADRVARWADTELFRVTVALNFRPEAIDAQMKGMSDTNIEAFWKDRADLSAGQAVTLLTPASAEAQFAGLLETLENSLQADFLFGDTPSIADFSVYHCLWFIAENTVNAALLDDRPAITAFMQRMADFGHGKFTQLSSSDALSVGTKAEPEPPTDASIDPRLARNVRAGDPVIVAATDYGRNPLSGDLVNWTAEEITILRNDPVAGKIMLHVPNTGFEVTAASG